MLNMVAGLARIAGVILAIVAGFVAIPNLNVALVLVVLGLIAGINMPREMILPLLATVIAYPILGTALSLIPAIGEQLSAVAGNLQVSLAGGLSTAVAMRLYERVKEDLAGLSAKA